MRSLQKVAPEESPPTVLAFRTTKHLVSNIVMRTVVNIIQEGDAAVRPEGVIVALSKPEEEYNEMHVKAGAPVNATTEHER